MIISFTLIISFTSARTQHTHGGEDPLNSKTMSGARTEKKSKKGDKKDKEKKDNKKETNDNSEEKNEKKRNRE